MGPPPVTISTGCHPREMKMMLESKRSCKMCLVGKLSSRKVGFPNSPLQNGCFQNQFWCYRLFPSPRVHPYQKCGYHNLQSVRILCLSHTGGSRKGFGDKQGLHFSKTAKNPNIWMSTHPNHTFCPGSSMSGRGTQLGTSLAAAKCQKIFKI